MAAPTPAQCFDAVKKMIALITKEAPQAEINVNTWGIAAWDKFPSPFSVAFWKKEVQLTRDLIGQPDIVGPDAGIEFPLHNYYRSLALKCYADAGEPPVLFPTVGEIQQLKQRGVNRLWGWPYFLTDVCDDGYCSGKAGLAQPETRYIKDIIDAARRLKLDGMIANAMAPNIGAESLNLYAFGRFCKDPTATPEQVIREFAGFISEPETVAELAQVLRFIENHQRMAGRFAREATPGKLQRRRIEVDQRRRQHAGQGGRTQAEQFGDADPARSLCAKTERALGE